jgi:hypothetical protein
MDGALLPILDILSEYLISGKPSNLPVEATTPPNNCGNVFAILFFYSRSIFLRPLFCHFWFVFPHPFSLSCRLKRHSYIPELGLADADLEALLLADPDPLDDGDVDAEGERLVLSLFDADLLAEADSDLDSESEADLLPEALCEADSLAEGLSLALGDADLLSEADPLALGDALALADFDSEADGERDALALADGL